MFTGIIEELGIVKNIERRNNILRLGIAVSFAAEVKIGDSIAVNGACLTVVKIENNVLFFEAVSETLNTTNIGKLKLNDRVNIEPALKSGDRMGGHIVTGHIDTVGVIRKKDKEVFEISFDGKFFNRTVEKGSVAIDGISLTIAKSDTGSFTVNIIPYTLGATTLGFKKQGDTVNIEFDYLGKYARQNSSSRITEEFLKEHGFLS